MTDVLILWLIIVTSISKGRDSEMGIKNGKFYTHICIGKSGSVMCQLPTGTNYRKSRANYRHIVYVWSTDKFTERGRAISGRSIEAYPPVFDFARFLDSEALSKAISHSLGCK